VIDGTDTVGDEISTGDGVDKLLFITAYGVNMPFESRGIARQWADGRKHRVSKPQELSRVF